MRAEAAFALLSLRHLDAACTAGGVEGEVFRCGRTNQGSGRLLFLPTAGSGFVLVNGIQSIGAGPRPVPFASARSVYLSSKPPAFSPHQALQSDAMHPEFAANIRYIQRAGLQGTLEFLEMLGLEVKFFGGPLQRIPRLLPCPAKHGGGDGNWKCGGHQVTQ